ncbi:PfkB family carbohydrate kinase [Opitutales bacterium]|nr:PfkB family carbohydrate kinase [Opitutales bacterium]
MKCNSKIILFENLSNVIEKEKNKGKLIVQCHGTFDLIHPGHIIHFREAKALGDILVITVTAENYVNKGPGRPFFNDELRALSISSLGVVDYVCLIPFPAAIEAIEAVQPDLYCKGTEYENPQIDVTGNFHDDIKTVEDVGGKVAYTGSVVFSSSKLLNSHFSNYSVGTKNLLQSLASTYSLDKIREFIDEFSTLKVLVIGDIIFDKYSTVSVQGLTSKNRILSSRFIDESLQPGGALAIFRHIREFTQNVKLLSLCGNEPLINRQLKNYLSEDENLVQCHSSITSIIKHRYVEPTSDGKELSKLFSVNHLDKNHPDKKITSRLLDKLKTEIKDFDLVLVADFGHGVMSEEIRHIVQDAAHFLAVNCQTNSNNFGFNIINKRYQRSDSFSLDQSEMSLACGKKQFDECDELENLRNSFGASYGWFTRGGSETIGIDRHGKPCFCDSLEKTVVDTVGAGDAFCAVVSLAAVSKQDLDLATLMGQISGALAVKIIGNTAPVRKVDFIKSLEAILKI